jgi:protein-L-isoaspartate(D-aspartate) O-methyltransferase
MNMPLNTTADVNDPIAHARYNLIEQQVRTWNVANSQVLEALEQVRREQFVPAAYRSMAFVDMEIPLQGDPQAALQKGQCTLKPNLEARMLQELQLTKEDRVLEIGAGSGHMAALLAQLAGQVVTLEIDPQLALMARENLENAGVKNASVRQADGALDPIPDGPFNAIVLSGSVAEVPARLLEQLAPGGRLVAITGQEPVMRVALVRRDGNRFDVSYPWDVNAPRLQHFGEPPAFRF